MVEIPREEVKGLRDDSNTDEVIAETASERLI